MAALLFKFMGPMSDWIGLFEDITLNWYFQLVFHSIHDNFGTQVAERRCEMAKIKRETSRRWNHCPHDLGRSRVFLSRSTSRSRYFSTKNTANPIHKGRLASSNDGAPLGRETCSPCIAFLPSCFLLSSLSSLAFSRASSRGFPPTFTPFILSMTLTTWPSAASVAT